MYTFKIYCSKTIYNHSNWYYHNDRNTNVFTLQLNPLHPFFKTTNKLNKIKQQCEEKYNVPFVNKYLT